MIYANLHRACVRALVCVRARALSVRARAQRKQTRARLMLARFRFVASISEMSLLLWGRPRGHAIRDLIRRVCLRKKRPQANESSSDDDDETLPTWSLRIKSCAIDDDDDDESKRPKTSQLESNQRRARALLWAPACVIYGK